MSILHRNRDVSADPAATASQQDPAGPPVMSPPRDGVSRTRTSTAWFGICTVAVALVVLIVFMLQNTGSVEVTFLWMHGSVSLALALLIAGVGAVRGRQGQGRDGGRHRRLARVRLTSRTRTRSRQRGTEDEVGNPAAAQGRLVAHPSLIRRFTDPDAEILSVASDDVLTVETPEWQSGGQPRAPSPRLGAQLSFVDIKRGRGVDDSSTGRPVRAGSPPGSADPPARTGQRCARRPADRRASNAAARSSPVGRSY